MNNKTRKESSPNGEPIYYEVDATLTHSAAYITGHRIAAHGRAAEAGSTNRREASRHGNRQIKTRMKEYWNSPDDINSISVHNLPNVKLKKPYILHSLTDNSSSNKTLYKNNLVISKRQLCRIFVNKRKLGLIGSMSCVLVFIYLGLHLGLFLSSPQGTKIKPVREYLQSRTAIIELDGSKVINDGRDDLLIGLLESQRSNSALESLQRTSEHLFGARMWVLDVEVPTNANQDTHGITKLLHSWRSSRNNETIASDECFKTNQNNKCRSWVPRVLRVLTDDSQQNVTNSFAYLYSKGVRYFYVNELESIIGKLNSFVKNSEFEDAHIESSITGVELLWNGSPFSHRHQEFLVESLVDGYDQDLIVPLITDGTKWVLNILEDVCTRKGKFIMDPVYLPQKGNLQNFIHNLSLQTEGIKDKVVIFISADKNIDFILSDEEITGILLGSIVLVHSPPSYLSSIVKNEIANTNAGKINLITSVFTVEESIINESDAVSDDENLNSFREDQNPEMNNYVTIIKKLNERERVKKILDAAQRLKTHVSYDYFPIKNNFAAKSKRISAFRMIYMPQGMNQLRYALDQPWFIESKFTATYRNGNYSLAKEHISHNIIFIEKVSNFFIQSQEPCVNEKFRAEIRHPLTGTINILNNLKKLDKIILPKLHGISASIDYICYSPNKVTVDTVDCQFSGSDDQLHCQYPRESSNMKKQSRTKRSIVVEPLNQQILSTSEYQSFKNYHYEKNILQKNVRFNRRSLYSVEYYTIDDRWENFKALIPQMLGCIGAASGCTFCFIFIFFSTVKISPGVCMGACGVAVGGSCTTVIGLGIQRTLHQTVICTELYRQGYLSTEAYLADANFGLKLNKTHPEALRLYRSLARPIVTGMKQSKAFTYVVSIIAGPWMEHMEYSEGLHEYDNFIGRGMMNLALYMLTIIGHLEALPFEYINILALIVTFFLFTINKRVCNFL